MSFDFRFPFLLLGLFVALGMEAACYAGKRINTNSGYSAFARAVASPEQTLRAYYDFIAHGQCDLAARLRPGYSLAKCSSIQEVGPPIISRVDDFGDLAILHLEIAINISERSVFSGFVSLAPSTEGWSIISASFKSGNDLETYKLWLSGNRFITQYLSPSQISEATQIPLNAPKWHDIFSGSHSLLASCWSEDQLKHVDGEEKPRKTGPNAYMEAPDLAFSTYFEHRTVASDSLGSIRRVDTHGKKLVALTFDLCEQNNDLAGYDGRIVDILRNRGVRATFFAGGKWMATHESRALQLLADPLFEIGNHAWTHGNLRVLRGEEARLQILGTQLQYKKLWNELMTLDCATNLPSVEKAKLQIQMTAFRFPYGTCSPDTLAMVNKEGLSAIQWSVVSGDPDVGQSAEDIIQGVMKSVVPGAIILMHANGRGWNTALALPELLDQLSSKGYQFLTISELLSAGTPIAVNECYENIPGDNVRYDRIFGKGTGD